MSDFLPPVVARLSATSVEFTEAFAAAGETMTGFAAEAAEVGATTQASMDEAAVGVAELGAVAEEQSTAVTASNDKIMASFAALSASADRTAEQFYVDYTAMAARTQKLAAEMEAAELKAAASTEAMGAKMDAVAAQSTGFAATVESASKKMLLVGAAGAVITGVTVKMAADYESATTRLVTSAGETEANLETVRDGILSMAGAVGMSAEDLAKGMYTVESAGYHGADGLTVLKAAAQGAKEENASLTTVADAVSTALTDYHLPADQAALVTSQLVTAVGQGKTTMEEFSGSLHSITPLAASLGLSLADVTGTLAEMTAHGMSADQASQNLADTLRHMISPTQSQRAELAQLGLTATDLSDSLSKKGLAGTLDMLSEDVLQKMGPSGKMLLNAFNTSKDAAANLQETLGKLPPAAAKLAQGFMDGSVSMGDWKAGLKGLPADQAALATSFLSVWNQANGFTNALKNGSPQAQNYTQAIKALTGDATGLNTTLMVTGENSAGTAHNIDVISKATVEAGGNVKGWHDIQVTFNQRLSEAKDGMGALAIAVGQRLMPPLSAILGVVSHVGQWFGDNKVAADALAITLGVMLAGGAVTALGKLVAFGAGLVTGPIKALINGSRAVWGFSSDLIGALGDATNAADSAGGKIGAFVSNTVSGVGKVAKSLGGAVADGARWATSMVTQAGRVSASAVSSAATTSATWIASTAKVAATGAANFVRFATQTIAQNARVVGSAAASAASTSAAWVASAVAMSGRAIAQAAIWVTGTLVQYAVVAGAAIVSAATTVAAWVAANIAMIVATGGIILLLGAVVAAAIWLGTHWSEVWHGIQAVAETVGNAVRNAWNAVIDWFRQVPGWIGGFFADAGRWLVNAGRAILDGFLDGLKSAWNSVTSFISGIGNWIADHKGPIEYDRQLLVPHGNAIMGGLLQGLTTGGAKVQSYLDKFTTGIGDTAINGTVGVNAVGTFGAGGGGGVQNIYLTVQMNPRDVQQFIQQGVLRKNLRNSSNGLTVGVS